MLTPGIYPGFPEAEYHADCCAAPSLSASLAKRFFSHTPAHVFAQHPKLNPEWKPQEFDSTKQRKLDFGSAVHAMLLEGADHRIAMIDATDYKGGAAKEQRAAAYENRKIPLLTEEFDRANEVVAAARRQLLETEVGSFIKAGGQSEVTLVWNEVCKIPIDVTCRARLDWLSDDYKLILDLKTDSTTANPRAFQRRILQDNMDVQQAFYKRGVKQLTGVEPHFLFAVVEGKAPFALSLVGLDPGWTIEAEKRRIEAVETWADCMQRGEWSGYSRRPYWLELPPWAEALYSAGGDE